MTEPDGDGLGARVSLRRFTSRLARHTGQLQEFFEYKYGRVVDRYQHSKNQ